MKWGASVCAFTPVVRNGYPTYTKTSTIPTPTTIMKTISFVRMAAAVHYTNSFV